MYVISIGGSVRYLPSDSSRSLYISLVMSEGVSIFTLSGRGGRKNEGRAGVQFFSSRRAASSARSALPGLV